MLVGTATSGQSTRPPITLASAPSIPATTMMTRARSICVRWLSTRCRPATPASYAVATRLPRARSVSTASSATGMSEVPAVMTSTEPRVVFGGRRVTVITRPASL